MKNHTLKNVLLKNAFKQRFFPSFPLTTCCDAMKNTKKNTKKRFAPHRLQKSENNLFENTINFSNTAGDTVSIHHTKKTFYVMLPCRYDALENKNIASTRLVTINIKKIYLSFSFDKKKDTVTFVSCCTHAQARTHYIKSERFTCSSSLAVSAVRRPQDIEEFHSM